MPAQQPAGQQWARGAQPLRCVGIEDHVRCAQVMRALLQNEHLSLEPHLHQLIPVILTCLVAKSLGSSPAEDHWSVRDAAGALLRGVVAKFGAAYADLAPRISRQLLRAFLDAAKPLTTHYGEHQQLQLTQAACMQLP